MDVDKLATGEVWLGKKALELNLCDELGTSDDILLQFLKGTRQAPIIKGKESMMGNESSIMKTEKKKAIDTGGGGANVLLITYQKKKKNIFQQMLSSDDTSKNINSRTTWTKLLFQCLSLILNK